MQEKKPAVASYFSFIVLIFLGIFIYMGWMLSSGTNSNSDKIKPAVTDNTPAMTVNTSKNEAVETSGIQLIPEKPENIEQSFITDIKPIEAQEIETLPAADITEKKAVKPEPEAVQEAEKIKPEKKIAKESYTPQISNIYIVRRNDTLTGIAKQRLGSARRWREIARLNTDVLPNPHRLKPGIRLRLPQSKNSANSPKEITVQTYTVRKTDSLYSLAVRFYGTPRAADIIRKANSDQLSETSEISEGMILKIPQQSVLNARDGLETSVDGMVKYRVKSGDTLSEISKHFYNSSISYDKILEANPDIRDVKNLKVGSVIKIPAKK
ncbi:MAG: LysM peptidoglycan-binding domain-containing protein [Planctomycetota bacterium]